MREQDIVELNLEAENEHNEFAVAVYRQHEITGYFPKINPSFRLNLLFIECIVYHISHTPDVNLSMAGNYMRCYSPTKKTALASINFPVCQKFRKITLSVK